MFSEAISASATTISHLKSQIQSHPNCTMGHTVEQLKEPEGSYKINPLQNKCVYLKGFIQANNYLLVNF